LAYGHGTIGKVAVKLSLPDTTGACARRVEAEARALALLGQIQGVPRFHWSGRVDGDRAYLVMELVQGESLDRLIARGALDLRTATQIGASMARTLGAAHSRGVVHRDIKPANAMIRPDGSVAVIDFGLAGVIGDQATDAVGTSVRWAPPEMYETPPAIDPRSDVFGVAAVVYACLTGHSPFQDPLGGDTDARIWSRVLRGHPKRLDRPDLPASLEPVLRRALDKDPAARYDQAEGLAEVLMSQAQAAREPSEQGAGLPPPPRSQPLRAASATDDQKTDSGGPLDAGQPVGADETKPQAPVDAVVGLIRLDGPRGPDPDATSALPPIQAAAGAEGPAPGPNLPDDSAPYSLDGTDHPASSHNPAGASRPGRAGRSRADRRRRRRIWAAVAAGAVVLAAIAALAVLPRVIGSGQVAPSPASSPSTVAVHGVLPAPINLAGARREDGTVLFTWSNPAPEAGDKFEWALNPDEPDPVHQLTDTPAVTIEGEQAAGPVCLSVSLVRADLTASPEATACV
jgi:serine/threonine protein kinase